MQQGISVAEARAVDQDAVQRLGMPSILLMENASRAVAEAAREMGDSYFIYCGPGNNGGDGLAAARHLGAAAKVYLWAEPNPKTAPDAYLQLQILCKAGYEIEVGALPPEDLPADAVCVDAMFGTGLTRELSGVPRTWVEHFNGAKARKLSVDIPSGLHGDTGHVLGVACRAEVTVTFVAPKLGMLLPVAQDYVGDICVVGLGLP